MQDCAFCTIVAGKMPSYKVYEDSVSIAFLDINPRNPGHTLVIPKKHYETVFDMPSADSGRLFESVKKVAGMVRSGVKAQGINIAQSNGKAAGQVVPHVHFHIIPRFVTENPPGLEGILPAKRLDDESNRKIVDSIRRASGEEHAERYEEKREERREEKPRPKKETEHTKKKKAEEEDFEEMPEEEISFDF